MNSVLVDVSSIAGTILTRRESGPTAWPGMLDAPASMAPFPKTQVEAPRNRLAFRKSLKEKATLSALTPIFGWSWVTLLELSALYTCHVPAGSLVSETAKTSTLPNEGVTKATREANQRPLIASYRTR